MSKCYYTYKYGNPSFKKAKAKFDEGNCVGSLRYLIGKYTTNEQEDNKISSFINDLSLKGMFASELSKQDCAGFIQYALEKEECGEANINYIMSNIAPGIVLTGEADSL